MSHDYSLYGWRLRSEVALPELAVWAGDEREPELAFALGAVPDATGVVVDDGRVIVHVAGVARYLIEDGGRITIDPVMASDAPDVRLFLLGTALGCLCHQRGVIPIQAAAVAVDGRAVLLAGGSGAGKSVLAEAFLRRGHEVLTDDIAVMSDGLILPGPRRISLWRDAAERAGWDVATLARCREAMEKYALPLPDGGTPLPPAALIHLVRGDGSDAIRWSALRGAHAVEAMRGKVYRARTLAQLVKPQDAVRRIGEAAGPIPKHLELARPVRFSALEATVDAIIDAVRTA